MFKTEYSPFVEKTQAAFYISPIRPDNIRLRYVVFRDPLVGMVKADTPHSFFRWFKKVGAAVLFFYLPAGYSPIS